MPTVSPAPRFWNLVSIQLLSAFSVKPDQKYLTWGCQQQFITAPVSRFAYHPHKKLSDYIADSVNILFIYDRAETISPLILDHLHQQLYIHQDYYLHIPPFKLILRIRRLGSDSNPTVIQCVLHAEFGLIFGLSLHDITPYSTIYIYNSNLVPHYLKKNGQN